MGDLSDVKVDPAGITAFIALILAVVIIIATVYARRRGHLQSRGALLAVAVLVALLAAYGMTGGRLPPL